MLRQKFFLLAILGVMTVGYVVLKSRPSNGSSAAVPQQEIAAIAPADHGVKVESSPRTDGKESAQLIVRCEKKDGTGVGRATVFFTRPEGSSLLNMRTDATGDAPDIDLAPGRYTLCEVKDDIHGEPIEAVAKGQFPMPLELEAGQTTKVTILIKRRDLPKLVVDVKLKGSGRPLPSGRVSTLRVEAIGALLNLNEVSPGEFHGEYEFRFSTATHFEIPARFRLEGRGFDDTHWTMPIPSRDKVVHLSVERDLPLLTDTAKGCVIDGDTERPIGNVSFRLHVRQSPMTGSFMPVDVHSRDDGTFDVPHVQFPCELYVFENRDGERWAPGPGAAVRLESASDVAWIRRYRANGVVAQFSKRVIEAIGSVESAEVWVDCLPLTRIAEPRQLEIGLSKRLDSPKVADLLRTEKLAIGHLPIGRYRITVVIGNLGTFETEYERRGKDEDRTFVVDIETSGRPLEFDLATWAPQGGCVIDGYVPSTLAVVIRDELLRRPMDRSAHRLAYAPFRPGETVSLASSNVETRVVTVVTPDDRVVHTKTTVWGRAAGNPADNPIPNDVTVSGRVVDREGRPIVGAVVNLTGLWGGEDKDQLPVPTTVEMRAIRTDDDGRWKIDGVTQAPYVVSVAELVVTKNGADREFRYAPSSLRIIDLNTSAPALGEIKLGEDGHSCSCGRVHLSEGFRH